MTSSLYIPQWAADNGNYMPRPSIDDSEDCSDGNVPILIDLKGPVQCLADGAGAGAAALGYCSGSGSGSGSGSCPSEHMDALKGDFCSQFLLNSAAERPNIDFLYQVANFTIFALF